MKLSCCCGGLVMVERVLVVGPKDCLAMVDELAPKGFEIMKALYNSREATSALPGAHSLVGFVQQMVSERLYKAAHHLRLVHACLPATIKPISSRPAGAKFRCATMAAPTR